MGVLGEREQAREGVGEKGVLGIGGAGERVNWNGVRLWN